MIFSRISKEVQELLATCPSIATRYNTPVIGPEHVLFAILTKGDQTFT